MNRAWDRHHRLASRTGAFKDELDGQWKALPALT
jgi:hypothetical protein